MTQSQSSVIKFNSFIFLPPKISDSKTTGGGMCPSFPLGCWGQKYWGDTLGGRIFYHLESVIAKPWEGKYRPSRWDVGGTGGSEG